MSKQSRRLEQSNRFFDKPDFRTTAEKIAEMQARREADKKIGTNPRKQK